MSRRKSSRTLTGVLLLSALCITGLIGMLMMDGPWDTLFFCCSALPLAIGLWRWYVYRNS